MEEIITIIFAVIIIAETILFLIIKSLKSHEPLPSKKEDLLEQEILIYPQKHLHSRPPILGNLQEDLPNLSGDYLRSHTDNVEITYKASDMGEEIKSNETLYYETLTQEIHIKKPQDNA